MKLFSLFTRKDSRPFVPLWSMQLHGEAICYNGEDIPDFLKKFDNIEDQVISLWNINELTWKDYQRMIAEVQEAKQMFVRFAYN
jgi:hypothetical protein